MWRASTQKAAIALAESVAVRYAGESFAMQASREVAVVAAARRISVLRRRMEDDRASVLQLPVSLYP